MGYIRNCLCTIMLIALVSAQLEADKLCIYKSQGNIWRISSAAPGEGTITIPYPAQNKEIEFGIWEKVKCGDDEGYALMTDLGTGKCTLLTGKPQRVMFRR